MSSLSYILGLIGVFVSMVSSYSVVNMRPCVFVSVMCQWSHPTVL